MPKAAQQSGRDAARVNIGEQTAWLSPEKNPP